MERYKLKNHKGQTTPGLMLGTGIVMFLFILVAIFAVNQQIKLGEIEGHIYKRGECLKIANLINAVYVAGDGAQVQTETDYIITVYNTSQISVGSNASVLESTKPNIAFLASEGGPTQQDFYNTINSEMTNPPDWYKICFSDLGGDDCSQSDTSWINTEIENDFIDLMNNLSNYDTLYLESPAIHPGTTYREDILNWVSEGHSLIIAGDFMCNAGFSSDCATCYGCENEGDLGNNIWSVSNVSFYQKAGNTGFTNKKTVFINASSDVLGLSEGDYLNFNKFNYIRNQEATNFIPVGYFLDKSYVLEDSRGEIAVAQWDYGDGRIYYFSDPRGNHVRILNINKDFALVLSEMASILNLQLAQPGIGADILCHFSAFSSYYQVYGDIIIRNENNYIYLENVNST